MGKNKFDKLNNMEGLKSEHCLKLSNAKMLAFVFFAFNLIILMFCIAEKDRGFSDVENRSLARLPRFSISSIADGSYTENFEKYAQDTVILRDFWVKLKNTTEFLSLKKDNGSAYFGKNGQLFGMEKNNIPMLRKNINSVMIMAENSGLNTKVLLAPTASLTLKEYLPQNVENYMQNSLLENAKELLGESFVDARQVLKEHKDEYIYYKTDHHWTSLGAYYAYTELARNLGFEPVKKEELEVKKLASDFEGTTAAKAATFFTEKDEFWVYTPKEAVAADCFDFDGKAYPLFDTSYLVKRDKYAYFLGGNPPLLILQRQADEQKKIEKMEAVMLIKDSYANSLAPFLLEHYQRVYLLDPRYYRKSVKQLIDDIRFKDDVELTDVVVLYNAPQFSIDVNVAAIAR